MLLVQSLLVWQGCPLPSGALHLLLGRHTVLASEHWLSAVHDVRHDGLSALQM